MWLPYSRTDGQGSLRLMMGPDDAHHHQSTKASFSQNCHTKTDDGSGAIIVSSGFVAFGRNPSFLESVHVPSFCNTSNRCLCVVCQLLYK